MVVLLVAKACNLHGKLSSFGLVDISVVKMHVAVISSRRLCYSIFTMPHGMQTWSSDENSVCLSVKCMDCDKMEESSVHIFIPYERSFSLVF